MAINKRKVLEAARKYAQKGAKQRALAEYEKLVKHDPRDAKLLLEVGDTYRRWGQVEEAIAQYTKVANRYRKDGFEARAVAVFKQILNLDPKRYAAYVALAELYQLMNLDAEANGALQVAADGYYKEGHRREALELLRKMASLDPTNTTSRLKVADLLEQEGLKQEAVSEYEEVVVELTRQGAVDRVVDVHERILELAPGRVDVHRALADALIGAGELERAEPHALRTLELAPDPDSYQLVIDLYGLLENDTRLTEVTRDLARFHRERGDENRARDVLQRLPAEEVLPDSGLSLDRSEEQEQEGLFGDDELLDDDEFLLDEDDEDADLSDGSVFGGADSEGTRESGEPSGETSTAGTGSEEAALPDGDPDQLFAEASVYLRYGKTQQAIASLKGILAQEPEHRDALEKLGEVHAEAGESEQAVASWQRAAESALAAGEDDAFAILCDRIRALDSEAADRLAAATPARDSASALREPKADSVLEAGRSEAEESGAAPQPDASVDCDSATTDTGAESGSGVGITFGDGFDADATIGDFDAESVAADELETSQETGSEAPGAADGPLSNPRVEIEIDERTEDEDEAGEEVELCFDVDVDVGVGVDVDANMHADIDTDSAVAAGSGAGGDSSGFGTADVTLEERDEAPLRDGSTALGCAEVTKPACVGEDLGQSTTTAAQIKEDLEEAEFYVEQGLAEEAEAVYRRILGVAPNHPSALLRLGELAAARGADPAAVHAPTEGDATCSGDDSAEPDVADESQIASETRVPLAEVQPAGEDLTEVEWLGGLEDTPTESPTAGFSAGALCEGAGESAIRIDDSVPLDASSGVQCEASEASAAVSSGEEEAARNDDAACVSESEADDQGGDAADVTEDSEVRDAETERVEEGDFDLGEALRDVFEDTANEGEAVAAQSGLSPSTVNDGFESIFADFKKGVSATLEEGDYETRYDLGIAYREMELFDDAISEFRVCLGSPERRAEALYMMGLCAFDLDRFADAINHFEQALSGSDLPVDRQAGIYFDLGRSHAASGDVARASDAFDRVRALVSDFPGVDKELEALHASSREQVSAGLQDGDADLESFEDLLADADADSSNEEGEVEESFESFDDVITEAEAIVMQAEEAESDTEPAVAEPECEAEVDTEPEVDTAPHPPEVAKKRARKGKKKISFV